LCVRAQPAPYSAATVSPPLKGKHFLHIDDFSTEELQNMLDLGLMAKGKLAQKQDTSFKPFLGYTMCMIFTKPSARTRISFETGFKLMGGEVIIPDSISIGKREPTKDIARVVSRYNDVIMARLNGHEDLLELAEHSRVPIINGLTDYNHPCQIMADVMTIIEKKGKFEGLKVVYVGDGNNIVNSWLRLSTRMSFEFTCVCPPGYEPHQGTVELAKAAGKSTIIVTNDPQEGVKGADVIYTDVWASMGQKDEADKRKKDFFNYQVNKEMMARTGKDTLFMHCLPAERPWEVTDEVIESDASVVWDQAENRMHAQNGILLHCMEHL